MVLAKSEGNVGEQTIELGQRHRGVPAVAIVLLTQDTETS